MRWTAEQEAILLAHAGSKSATEIATLLGRTKPAVTKKAYTLNISLDVGGRGRTLRNYADETVRRAKELRAQSYYIPEIARELGVPLGTVTTWLYEYTRASVEVGMGV